MTAEQAAQLIIGLEADFAHILIGELGLVWRVVNVNDKAYVITRDLKRDRVNVHIDNNQVVKAYPD